MADDKMIGTGDGQWMRCARCDTLAVFIGSHWTHSTDDCLANLCRVLSAARAELAAETAAHGRTQLALDEAVAMKEAFGSKAHQLDEQLKALRKETAHGQ